MFTALENVKKDCSVGYPLVHSFQEIIGLLKIKAPGKW